MPIPFSFSACLAVADGANGHHAVTIFMLQLAVIFIAARLGGLLVQRVLKGPAVLGELAAGILIGPYAFGALTWPGLGPLFPLGATEVIPPSIYALATMASVVLLFLAGLETDLGAFARFAWAGFLVGAGGLITSFALGVGAARWFGIAAHWSDPAALFLGTASAATRVGITARVLSHNRRLNSPEAVTILAGAVFDDVFSIILLAIVVGLSRGAADSAGVDWRALGWLSAKAVGFGLAFTTLGILFSRPLTRLLKKLHSNESVAVLCLGLSFMMAGLSEQAGLALIIGAYITGLALSRTDIAAELQAQLQGFHNTIVPVFFCVMGMMVNLRVIGGALVFGAVYTLLAILAKLVGCGLPALAGGFNLRGGLRIGLGMIPRGEVALIVAGMGLSAGVITQDIFGVTVLMAMLTTLAAPPPLMIALRGRDGYRRSATSAPPPEAEIGLDLPSDELAAFLRTRIERAFRSEEFYVHRVNTTLPTYHIRKDDLTFTLTQHGPRLQLSMPPQHQAIGRLILLDEFLALQDILQSLQTLKSTNQVGAGLVTGLHG
ncbi:MAG: cation:proton antiporter [Candidatus Marinimicrobia bacterium]|nr:cation:proton antiporter [Candidatus Neomarinimicrobiota bacterium]